MTPHCPACGSELCKAVTPSGLQQSVWRLHCRNPDCSRPTAALEVLSDPETEHVLTLKTGSFELKHPLRERLDGALSTCDVGEWIAEFGGIMVQGRTPDERTWQLGVPYRVWMDYDSTTDPYIDNDTHLTGEPLYGPVWFHRPGPHRRGDR